MAQILDQDISKNRTQADKANNKTEEITGPDRAIPQNPKPGEIEYIIGIAWQNKIRSLKSK